MVEKDSVLTVMVSLELLDLGEENSELFEDLTSAVAQPIEIQVGRDT